jgi:hypothetical protein
VFLRGRGGHRGRRSFAQHRDEARPEIAGHDRVPFFREMEVVEEQRVERRRRVTRKRLDEIDARQTLISTERLEPELWIQDDLRVGAQLSDSR